MEAIDMEPPPPIRRVRTDTLAPVDGSVGLDGRPFTGIGITVGDHGAVVAASYRDGLPTSTPAPATLARLGADGLLVAGRPGVDLGGDDRRVVAAEGTATGDDGETVIVGDRPLDGWLATFDGADLVSLDEHHAGHPTNRSVTWYPGGALDQLTDLPPFDVSTLTIGQRCAWWPDGRAEASFAAIRSSEPTATGGIAFDEQGRVRSIGARAGYLDAIPGLRDRLRFWAWATVDELLPMAASTELTLDEIDRRWRRPVLDSLAAGGGLGALSELTTVELGEDGWDVVLSAPRLRSVTVEHPGNRAVHPLDYDAVLGFLRRTREGTVRVGRVALLDRSHLAELEANHSVSAHVYNDGFADLVGWQQWTEGLTDDELDRLYRSPALVYVHAVGNPAPETRQRVEAQLRRLKTDRPGVRVRCLNQEIT